MYSLHKEKPLREGHYATVLAPLILECQAIPDQKNIPKHTYL